MSTLRLLFSFLVLCVCFCLSLSASPPAVSTVSLVSQSHPVEWHHSLKPPLDKSQVYWNYGGATVLTKNFVRLVPSTQDRRGWLWNEYPLESTNWETEIRFEVFSKPHFGGDGMAFWVLAAENDPSFAQNPNALTGPLFGLKSEFTGFGVIFDVYDNDGKRNNPAIFVVQNPKGGEFKYNHDNDFENDMVTTKPEQLPQLPGAEKVEIAPGALTKSLTHRCVADFRNTGKVNKALIRFLHNIVHVYIDTADGMGYKFCLAVRLEEKFANHHFALSAATGQVADNMDILEITTRYLSETDTEINDENLPQLGNGKIPSQHNTLMGFFWFVLSTLQFFLILISIWQYRTLDTMKRGRIDENNIAKELNSIVMPHYSAQLFATILLLVWGTWGTLICNLPLAIYRIYLISQKKYAITVDSLVGTKEHTKTAKLSLETLLKITVANYALLQIYYLYKLFF